MRVPRLPSRRKEVTQATTIAKPPASALAHLDVEDAFHHQLGQIQHRPALETGAGLRTAPPPSRTHFASSAQAHAALDHFEQVSMARARRLQEGAASPLDPPNRVEQAAMEGYLEASRFLLTEMGIPTERVGQRLVLLPDPNGPKISRQAALAMRALGTELAIDPAMQFGKPGIRGGYLETTNRIDLTTELLLPLPIDEGAVAHELTHALRTALEKSGRPLLFHGLVHDSSARAYTRLDLQEIPAHLRQLALLASEARNLPASLDAPPPLGGQGGHAELAFDYLALQFGEGMVSSVIQYLERIVALTERCSRTIDRGVPPIPLEGTPFFFSRAGEGQNIEFPAWAGAAEDQGRHFLEALSEASNALIGDLRRARELLGKRTSGPFPEEGLRALERLPSTLNLLERRFVSTLS